MDEVEVLLLPRRFRQADRLWRKRRRGRRGERPRWLPRYAGIFGLPFVAQYARGTTNQRGGTNWWTIEIHNSSAMEAAACTHSLGD